MSEQEASPKNMYLDVIVVAQEGEHAYVFHIEALESELGSPWERRDDMSQLFFIIGSIMSVVMIVVVGLLSRKATFFRGAYIPAGLAGGSFGVFAIGVYWVVFSRHPYPYPLPNLIVGFILALAAGAVFMWQRSQAG